MSAVNGPLLNNTPMWVCGCVSCCEGSTAQQCFHVGLWLCLLCRFHSSTILPCGFVVVFLAVKVPLLNNAFMRVYGCVQRLTRCISPVYSLWIYVCVRVCAIVGVYCLASVPCLYMFLWVCGVCEGVQL